MSKKEVIYNILCLDENQYVKDVFSFKTEKAMKEKLNYLKNFNFEKNFNYITKKSDLLDSCDSNNRDHFVHLYSYFDVWQYNSNDSIEDICNKCFYEIEKFPEKYKVENKNKNVEYFSIKEEKASFSSSTEGILDIECNINIKNFNSYKDIKFYIFKEVKKYLDSNQPTKLNLEV